MKPNARQNLLAAVVIGVLALCGACTHDKRAPRAPGGGKGSTTLSGSIQQPPMATGGTGSVKSPVADKPDSSSAGVSGGIFQDANVSGVLPTAGSGGSGGRHSLDAGARQ